jgi:hypothetical protein
LCIYRELITNEMLNTNNCRYTLRDWLLGDQHKASQHTSFRIEAQTVTTLTITANYKASIAMTSQP